MHDQPSQHELIEAVKRFISDTAMPQLSGRAAFHARVALNVLDILDRDVANRSNYEEKELERLHKLMETNERCKTLAEINKLVCERIASGELGVDDTILLKLLKANAIDQLDVDQPKYSGLKIAKQSLNEG